MLNRLFFRSDGLTRQLSAPLVNERRQYLAQCAAQGMSKHTMRMKDFFGSSPAMTFWRATGVRRVVRCDVEKLFGHASKD
jgi:hypothetical protein